MIICDIESTCWEHNTIPPKNEISEIIEIGLAVVNLNSLLIEKEEGILVKPNKSKVSKFCTELTTLTQEQINDGLSFSKACAYLKAEYDSKKTTWASWGSYDRKMFESQCRNEYIEYPFGKDHLNLKNLFAIFYGLKKELNLPDAMNYLGLSFEGTLHRGVDDASNIAKIFIEMTKKVRK